jgi:hypothetical protein
MAKTKDVRKDNVDGALQEPLYLEEYCEPGMPHPPPPSSAQHSMTSCVCRDSPRYDIKVVSLV